MKKNLSTTLFSITLTVTLGAFILPLHAQNATPKNAGLYANRFDTALAGVFDTREKDWRNGAIVYQVLVDRFAPSANLALKKSLYPEPKKLHAWDVVPKAGIYLVDAKVWSHEIDFWGGDLQSLGGKLDYIKSLGVDVLYLNPTHLGYTNHKYDSLDFLKVSPEFGSREDIKKLARETHAQGMKIMLDGSFNHMGRNSEIYKQAQSSDSSAYRDWFYFGPQFPGGSRSWAKAQNLPELNLENEKVRDYIFAKPDSVVQSYLADGIDGWRLDVAFDIGFNFLQQLTEAAHKFKPGSAVIGEIANYPKEWFPSVDGVMNFTFREIIMKFASEQIGASTAAQMLNRTIEDAGIESALKSWVLLDNHDNPRIDTALPDERQRKLAQLLQFTLPGSPNLYYGSELGMVGGEEPESRGPMRWDLVTADNASLRWVKRLIALQKNHRALRIGNFRLVTANNLLAFERYTDRVEDTVIVVVNPGKADITETVMIANSKLMNGALLLDAFGGAYKKPEIRGALTTLTVPAGSFLVLKPDVATDEGYTTFKRVQ
jgi:cyclomaltodextrinase / maltogenic alpha-amylase / neopullulanase